MKPLSFVAALLLLALPAVHACAGGNPRSDMVVDAAWLAGHVGDPGLVLLHVGDADEYAAGHIPGARLVTLDDLSVSEHSKTGLMLQMPSAEDLHARLEKLGISDGSRIVVYYGKDWVSPSTRIVFTLQYAGLGDHTGLLDGGMGAWLRAGGKLSKEVPTARPGKLAALQVQPIVVDRAYVRAHLDTPGIAIVDGRAAAYYDGIEVGGAHGQVDRVGHIKGARSIPFSEVTDDRLMLKSQAELQALFDRAGVAPGDTVVGYCHIGQQATAMLFAARLLGHPVLLYDGSFQDWSRGEDAPVEAGVAKRSP